MLHKTQLQCNAKTQFIEQLTHFYSIKDDLHLRLQNTAKVHEPHPFVNKIL